MGLQSKPLNDKHGRCYSRSKCKQTIKRLSYLLCSQSQAVVDNIICHQLVDSVLKAISDAAYTLFLFTDLSILTVKEILKIVNYNSCVMHLELFPTLSRVLQMCGFSSPLLFYEQYNVIVYSANSECLQKELDNFYIQVGKEHIPKSILILIQSYLLFIEKARDDV